MEFLLIGSAHFLALLSPGPDFFLVMQAALRLKLRYGVAICVGIALANAVYLVLAVAGLETIKQLEAVMGLLRYLGGAYLIFIGIMLLKAPRVAIGEAKSSNFIHQESFLKQLVLGFTSAILNPKNMIFYLALFTVMVSPETGLLTRCLYAIWMTTVVFVWDAGLVILFSNTRVKDRLGGWVFLVEKLSGSMLALFGILLPLV